MAHVKGGQIHTPAFYADAPYEGDHERSQMQSRLKKFIEQQIINEGYCPDCFEFRMTHINDDEGDQWVMLAEPYQFQAFWHKGLGGMGYAFT
jgi:hypothetical protein